MTDSAEAKTGERTPGPWVLGSDEDAATVLIGVDGEFADGHSFMLVAQARRHSLISRAEAEANAAFIAQACNAFPALIEALELIAGGFEGEGLEVENQWRKEVARSALEAAMKTEGR